MYDIKVIEKTVKALEKNNMSAVFIEDKSKLFELIDDCVKKDDTVAFGGSVTLFQTGTMDYIKSLDKQGKITLLDRNKEGISKQEVQKIYREAFFSNVYFTSSNAVTQDGFLYNVDGNGNRVSAMIFGPESVVVIVGYNKIVANCDEAVERVKNIAAPLNAKRLNINTPCNKTGKCMNCQSDNRICCCYTFFGKQRIKNRIKVIIIGEEYGY